MTNTTPQQPNERTRDVTTHANPGSTAVLDPKVAVQTPKVGVHPTNPVVPAPKAAVEPVKSAVPAAKAVVEPVKSTVPAAKAVVEPVKSAVPAPKANSQAPETSEMASGSRPGAAL